MADNRNTRNFNCGETLNAFTIRNLSAKTASLANRGDGLRLKVQSALKDLSNHLRQKFGIKFLEKVEKSHLSSWAKSLHARSIESKISLSTTSSYISAVNTVFSTNERSDLYLSAKEYCVARGQKFSNRNLSNSYESRTAFQDFCKHQYKESGDIKYLSLAHSAVLQYEAGLRFRESTQIKIATKQLSGHLNLTKGDGVKNNQPRTFEPLSMKGLRLAKTFVRDHSHVFGKGSLIPENLTYIEYKNWAYKQLDKFRELNPNHKNYHYHGNRHAFSHREYEKGWDKKVGIQISTPVIAGLFGRNYVDAVSKKTGLSPQEARLIFRQINIEVAEKLGHHRPDAAYAYHGK